MWTGEGASSQPSLRRGRDNRQTDNNETTQPQRFGALTCHQIRCHVAGAAYAVCPQLAAVHSVLPSKTVGTIKSNFSTFLLVADHLHTRSSRSKGRPRRDGRAAHVERVTEPDQNIPSHGRARQGGVRVVAYGGCARVATAIFVTVTLKNH